MPTQPERRSSVRVPLVQPCPYELSTIRGTDSMDLSQGQAFSVNVSGGGMLLLMSQAPKQKQVLEVRVPSTTGHKAVQKVAEVCWTAPVPVGDEGAMHLVGVRFLFEAPASA
jgi:c-di-GMP-binding flagellar brake protein YcgR